MKNLKKVAVILNGFIHDFATGYWLSAMIALFFLQGFEIKYPQLADLLKIVERFFFWNTVGGVVVILATGSARTFTYVENVFGTETEEARRKMLIAKHVVLLAIFAIGEYYAYGVTFQ